MAEQHWRVGTWNGHPNFECAHCPYATLYPRLLVGHLAVVHRVRVKKWPALSDAKRSGFASREATNTTATLDRAAAERPEQMKPSGAGGDTVADVRDAATATASTTADEE